MFEYIHILDRYFSFADISHTRLFRLHALILDTVFYLNSSKGNLKTNDSSNSHLMISLRRKKLGVFFTD